MAPSSYRVELTSSVAAKRIYKSFVLDGDNLLPKFLPKAIKSCTNIQGDGGVGTIKLILLIPNGFLKHRVDEVDHEKMTYRYTVIEGDIIADLIDSMSYHIEVVSTPEGESICKSTCTYNVIGDTSAGEEHIKKRKEGLIGMFKAVEAYLIANPTEYN